MAIKFAKKFKIIKPVYLLKKKFNKFTLIFFSTVIFSTIHSTSACTVMKINHLHHFMVGQNFDWGNKYTYLAVNPAGIKRKSMHIKMNGKSAEWISKYGSVTFDATNNKKEVDKSAVVGGINQHGLCANILWLEDSRYPMTHKKPELASLQWAQYFLDNVKTVNQAIKLAKTIEVEPTFIIGKEVKVHLFITDQNGNSAIMEYIHGHLKIYHAKNLTVPVLTNTEYKKSIQYLKNYKNFGGKLPLPGGYSSKSRFVLAANYLRTLPKITSNENAKAYLFNGLGYVIEIPKSTTPTVWSAVYDLSNKIIYYRDINNQNIRFLRLKDFDLSSGKNFKKILINNSFSGDLKKYL